MHCESGITPHQSTCGEFSKFQFGKFSRQSRPKIPTDFRLVDSFPSRGSLWGNDMNKRYNRILTPYSQKLRREMTKEEKHLWYDFLKALPFPVRRQKVFGNYILDFYIPQAKLVIELDGSQHYETSGIASDQERDLYLQNQGLQVLRYANSDINFNFSAVCEDILNHIGIP